jgi:hypothetical protein
MRTEPDKRRNPVKVRLKPEKTGDYALMFRLELARALEWGGPAPWPSTPPRRLWFFLPALNANASPPIAASGRFDLGADRWLSDHVADHC